MNSRYLVSIVVPTHNRSSYAVPCIKSMLSMISEEIQIVVHDTSNDSCDLKKWAAKQEDHRLKYVHWSGTLSMTENYERALALAEGEYISVIGDDDTVSEKVLEVAKYAKVNYINLITPKANASYYWPDFRSRFYGNVHAGRIYIKDFDGHIEQRDCHEGLRKTLKMACQGTEHLPKLYHGLVSKKILDDLRLKNGKIFFGVSPDISSSIALSLEGGHYHIVDYPFTLPGSAGGSNSGRSAQGKHKGDLSSDPHITPFKSLVWPSEIPKFFSVETVWSQAAWETLVGTGNNSWLDKTNLARLYALCFIRHTSYYPYIIESWKMVRKNGGVELTAILKELMVLIFEISRARLKRLMRPSASNGQNIVAIVDDVALARNEFDAYIASNYPNINFTATAK
ncbi:glycosyltransferase [Halopseudomonas pelagia]|uniref:Glycosyltransferase n=1 Tax=Halopseudomonas pelagia TaxID=553151 RepID=A0AA91Z569_9GAMM|nr:glycosyltransferase [Halopseudomonas pelagia]PCC98416.1 glycosyltransferase [Halopseudomonas pelagia]QFY57688.1 glycosyltransferase [Halopseudomonas pelagia]